MDFDCGRMGNLEGVFIADTEDVEILSECKNLCLTSVKYLANTLKYPGVWLKVKSNK